MDVANVTKVGAVILRLNAGQPQVLLNQPHPKPHTPEDLPPLGLVRGTRMYRHASGQMVDADHDGSTPPPIGAELEPVRATLLREAEEEAGLTAAMIEAARVQDLGAHRFASRTKTPYWIHWFAVLLDEAAADGLPLTGQKDALHTRWVTLAELKALVAHGKASAGYVPVVQMALATLALKAERD